MEVIKVLELVDRVTLSHIEEHSVAQDCADEEDEHEKDKDVEKGADRHHDRFEQALEFFSFASQAKHATDAKHAEDAGKLRTDGQNLALTAIILAAFRFRQGKLKAQVNKTRGNDEEIEFVPACLKVGHSVDVEFDHALQEEDCSEDVVCDG